MARAPIDLNEIALFVRVVDRGSLTAAAKTLGMPKSTVSRKLTQLETRLGVRLVQRTPRHLRLTEAGTLYYQRCANLLGQVEEAEALLTREEPTPRGLVRVSAGVDFGTGVLAGLIQEFLRTHPHITVDLHLTDRAVDLVAEGFDLAIRIGGVQGAELFARKLATTQGVLCASPAYLLEHGAPQSPAELEQHACLLYTAPPHTGEWQLQRDTESVKVKVQGRFSVNNLVAVRDAALAGLGIARLPTFVCRSDLDTGRLRRILGTWSAGERPVYAVYLGGKFVPTRLRLLLDFLVGRLPAALALQAGG